MNKKLNFDLHFINEDSTRFSNIYKKIDSFTHSKQAKYYFLDFLDPKRDGETAYEVMENDFLILEAEEKYKRFFDSLSDVFKNSFVISNIFYDVINKNNYEKATWIIEQLDKKDKYLFFGYVLYNKNKYASKIVQINQVKRLLLFFVSLSYRNNAFVDAIIFSESIIFIPNCTYGFSILYEKQDQIDKIKSIAANSGLYCTYVNEC